MVEVVTAGVLFLGKQALEIIQKAAKSYVEKRFKQFFSDFADQHSEEVRTALETAYAEVMAGGFNASLTALRNAFIVAGVSEEKLREFQTSVELFLNDEKAADHLWEAVLDPQNTDLPDADTLAGFWPETGRELPLPPTAIWPIVAIQFRKAAKETTIFNEETRPIFVAKSIDSISETLKRIGGIPVTISYPGYIKAMRQNFSTVNLAHFAPTTTSDPGNLIVTDIFEPQQVRENPPAIEIAKDELDQLCKEGQISPEALRGAGNEAIIAFLEQRHGDDAAENFRFQRISYTDQPEQPVLNVISHTHLRKKNSESIGSKSVANQRLIVLTGDPGSGKSTLLRYLLLGILNPPLDPQTAKPLEWTHPFTGSHTHFPLLIELRQYDKAHKDVEKVDSILDFIDYLGESQHWGIDGPWVDRRLKDGPSVIMFDGLDEVFDKSDRERIMREIAGFSRNYSKARLIVTSRPHGYDEGILRPAGFAHFRLQDLNETQKENFTRAWFQRVFPNDSESAEDRTTRVLSSLNRSAPVRLLAGNPLLLTMMCLIARGRELPEERAGFYRECLDLLVHQWDANRGLTKIEKGKLLNATEKKALLRSIAIHMERSSTGLAGNIISEEDLRSLVENWFKTQQQFSAPDAKFAAHEIIDGLWKRNYILCPLGPGIFGFLHRTFIEYLIATHHIGARNVELSDLREFFKAHGNQPEYSEVLQLICGLIGQELATQLGAEKETQWISDLILNLATLIPFPKGKNFVTLENQPNHLVIALRCLNEVRQLGDLPTLATSVLEICLDFLTKARIRNEIDADEPEAPPTIAAQLLEAIEEIAPSWPSGTSLELFESRKQHFDGELPIFIERFESTFIEIDALILADRQRIENYASEGKNPYFRSAALDSLGSTAGWIDDKLFNFFVTRALEDENSYTRSVALEWLARRNEWANEDTRHHLEERAVEDDNEFLRRKAMRMLVSRNEWIDGKTRTFLFQRATNDEHHEPRSEAIRLLVLQDEWADEEMRTFLENRVHEDEDEMPRRRALVSLARRDSWADERTRTLIEQRALDDKDKFPRSEALRLLVSRDRWADQNTRNLLEERALVDQDQYLRGEALSILISRNEWMDGRMNHFFKGIAMKNDNEDIRELAQLVLRSFEAN